MGAAALARSYFHGRENISAWSERVGEPKGVRPIATAFFTSGCSGETCEEPKRKERALASQAMCFRISSKSSWLV